MPVGGREATLADVDTQWKKLTEDSSSLNTPEMEEEPFSFSPVSVQESLLRRVPPVSESPPEDLFSGDLIAESGPRNRFLASEKQEEKTYVYLEGLYTSPEDIIPDGSSPRSRSLDRKPEIQRSAARQGLRGPGRGDVYLK